MGSLSRWTDWAGVTREPLRPRAAHVSLGTMRNFALILALMIATPTLAAEGGGKGANVGQYIDISPVAAPIIVNGKLLNYVFVSVRLNLAGRADAARWREKEPFFRDALVRSAHRTPFLKQGSYTAIDEAALKGAMMREAGRIAGPGVVAGVDVTSQTPQHANVPPPAAALPSRVPIP